MEQIDFNSFQIGEDIKKALMLLGYQKPTEVQERVIPYVLQNQDCIVRSQTGSGKTASFAIPICENVDWMENKPQALVITPTRELAVQVQEDISAIGKFKRVKAVAIYGRQPMDIQKVELKQKLHVVVGTPGRLMDHIRKGTLVLSHIKYVVIDEADKLLNMGFVDQVEEIINEIKGVYVTLLFSATYPEEIKKLAYRSMNTPVEVEIEGEGIACNKVEHLLYYVEEKDKFQVLQDVTVINNPDSCILFLRTRDEVEFVGNRMAELGYPCRKIHGEMEQKDRLRVMNDFKRGKFKYLVATDVVARGIDVENVSLVINYNIPYDRENYVHRTGRTGRAGQEGRAVTFVTDREKKYLHDIEEYLGFSLKSLDIPSREEVNQYFSAFDKKLTMVPKLKVIKTDRIEQEVVKLRFNVGKQKKFRAANLVGMITNIQGIEPEDIGIITVMDHMSYVEIMNGKSKLVQKYLNETQVMGKNIKIKEIK